jgi:hypothetical protein
VHHGRPVVAIRGGFRNAVEASETASEHVRPAAAALCRGRADLRQRPCVRNLAIDACLRRAVRPVLLRDPRSHLAGAAQALELGGRGRRRVLGCGRDAIAASAGLIVANAIAPKV